MALYKNAGFEFKFLGTMNGSSTSHTNAYFYPEKDMLAFIDLSMLNFQEASLLITPGLKRVVLFLTHLHDDHASGVMKLAFHIRRVCPSVVLEVLAGSQYAMGAFDVFYEMGGKPFTKNGRRFEQIRIYGQCHTGEILTKTHPEAGFLMDQRLMDKNQQFMVPDWFIQVIPTLHHPALSGAAGFAFRLNGKMIVYSGDTNTAEPFYNKVDIYASGDDRCEPMPTELYLDMEMSDSDVHLVWNRDRSGLMRLMRRDSNLKVALMHYDDHNITYYVNEFNRELGEERLFVAEPEKF